MTGWSQIQVVLDDGLAAARHAKASGRAVVGFLSNNVPVELIHAAGAFPLQLPTAPLLATPRADEFMERSFDPQARVVLEQLLCGELGLLDALVLPRSVDSFHRLYYYLCELRRSFALQLPEPVLYDVLQTPWASSQRYSDASTRDFAQRLAALTGRTIGATELASSIASYNRVRAALARMIERRRQRPCGVPGERAMEVFIGSQRMAPECFVTALDAWLATLPPASSTGVRTLWVGSAPDTAALHRTIAAAGGEVVCDYHWRGELLFGSPIAEVGDPFESVSRHYSQHSFSTRSFRDPAAALRAHAADSGADAVVFYFHPEDDALCWDEPMQRRALGLPALSLQSQRATFAALHEFFAGVGPEPSSAS